MKKLAKQKNIRYSALALYGNYSATGIYEGSMNLVCYKRNEQNEWPVFSQVFLIYE